MRFAVDLDTCENYAQCTYVAPDQFHLSDEGELSFRAESDSEYVSPDLTPAQEAGAEQAVGACPMQAIRIVD